MSTVALTVVAAKVAASQTNMPLLITPSAITGLGSITLADANSVRCYSDVTLLVEQAREVVSLDEIHTKVAALTTVSVTYFDYDGIRADYAVTATYGRNNVWTGYNAVYHLGDLVDSTGNGYTLTNNGIVTFTTGLIGDAASIQTAGQYLSTSNTLGLATSSNPTFTYFVKMPSELTVDRDFMNIQWNGAAGAEIRSLYEYNGGSRRVRSYRGPVTSFADVSGNIADNTWRFIKLTWTSGANGTVTSVNDGTDGLGNSSGTTNIAASTQFTMGSTFQYSHTRPIIGLMDEFRVASSVQSSTWVTTQYNNLSSNSTFWTASGGPTFTPTPLIYMMQMAGGMM